VDLIVSPRTVAFNTQPGTPPPALQSGEVVEALVLQLLENGSVRLSVANTLLDVQTQVPLLPGTMVRLAVKNTSDGIQLVIVGGNANSDTEAASTSGARALPTSGAADALAADSTDAPAASATLAASPDAFAQTSTTMRGDVQLSSPAAALSQAVRQAAAQQNGLAPLFADVADVTTSTKAGALPQQVRDAATQLLALRPQLDSSLSADDVKQAFIQSGLFLEARIAATVADPSSQSAAMLTPTSAPPSPSQPTSADSDHAAPTSPPPADENAPTNSAPPVLASDDLKAALTVFRQALKVWLASDASTQVALDASDPGSAGAKPELPLPTLQSAPSIAPDGPTNESPLITRTGSPPTLPAPPPPYRGAPISSQPVAPTSIPADASPRDIGARLLADTNGALSRQTLLQAASLPDTAQAALAQSNRDDSSGPRWNFEIPFATSQGTAVAQFEISRDGHSASAEGAKSVWRARFTLDVEPMGPVHAQVALIGSRTAVTLWAERADSAAKLRVNSSLLSDALKEAQLEPGDVLVRDGSPPRPQQPRPAGRFLDRAS
jgi:hypothetical protein